MFVSHGGRPAKENGRKRKGVDEYAAENRIDFTSRSIIRDGQLMQILVCRFCCQSIGARSDRIKEHLASKRHHKLKMQAIKEATDAGHDLSKGNEDNLFRGLLPEPPLNMVRFPGKPLVDLRGKGSNEGANFIEKNSDSEDMNYATPPPLFKPELVPNTPSPQFIPPAKIPQDIFSRGFEEDRGDGNRSRDASANSSAEESTSQVLRVKWGNYDLNLMSMFSHMKKLEHFVDVTLWCEGRTIKCHKVILSACSTYFEALLTEMPLGLYPVIFLKDMKFWEVESLVEFMYKGEVNIPQDKLHSLLKSAKSLKIKGLGFSPKDSDTSERYNNESGTNPNSTGNSSSHQEQQKSHSSIDASSIENNFDNQTFPNINTNSGHITLTRSRNSLLRPNTRFNNILDDNQHLNLNLFNQLPASKITDYLQQGSSTEPNLHKASLTPSVPQTGVPVARRKKKAPKRISTQRINFQVNKLSSPPVSPKNEFLDDDDIYSPPSDDSMTAPPQTQIEELRNKKLFKALYEESDDEEPIKFSGNYAFHKQGNISNLSAQFGKVKDDIDMDENENGRSFSLIQPQGQQSGEGTGEEDNLERQWQSNQEKSPWELGITTSDNIN